MKKCIILVLSLGLLLTLLAGCEYFVPDGILEEAEKNRPSFLPQGTNPPGAEDLPANVAGGVDEYGFTVFPAGNYLADRKFDTDEFLPDYDADPAFINFHSTSGYALCRTEDTIYSLRPGSSQINLIMYADKATGISGPLCGKPECLHRDSKCNAYVANRADGLCVYDGKLYWVNGGTNITRMNPDGTGRETVASVGSVYDNINNDMSVVFHRGYLYVAGSQHQVIENGVAMGSFTINAMPLDGSEGFTILRKLVDGTGPECLIKPVGNDLYIMLYYFDYDDEVEHKGAYDVVEFYRWDSKTRQAEFISSTQSVPHGLQFEKRNFHPVPGDGIYFQAYEYLDGKLNHVIYKYSVETDTYEKGAWLYGYDYLFYCQDFIITDAGVADTNRIVYTFNYDGNLLFSSDPVEEHGVNTFLGADSEYAYYNCIPDGDYVAVPLNGGDVIAIG